MILFPSIFINVPMSLDSFFVINSVCEIAAILAKASPLKPFVDKLNKSAALVIFEVE